MRTERTGASLQGRSLVLQRLPSVASSLSGGGGSNSYILRHPDVGIVELQPSKGMGRGHRTQLLLEDLRGDLGFIVTFLHSCTSFHQWRVTLGPSLPGKHGMLMASWPLLGRFCPGLCVQTSPFFSQDLNYCPSFVSIYICRPQM